MPAFNSELTIEESIQSILNQSYKNFELIIIDDCSSDKTLQIIEKYASQDDRIKILTQSKNQGVAMTRNLGIKISKGSIIAFCDSDDIWNFDKLKKQLPLLRSHDIVCSNFILEKINGSYSREIIDKSKFDYQDLLKYNYIANSSAIFNVLQLGKIYQENIGAEDFLMWLRLSKKSNKLIFRVQEPLITYRVNSKSLSGNKVKSAIWRWNILTKKIGLNYLKASYFMIFFIKKNIVKYLFKS